MDLYTRYSILLFVIINGIIAVHEYDIA